MRSLFLSAARSLRRFSRGEKPSKPFLRPYACDSSRIRANRTWLIAKTARFARLFEFLIVRLYTQSAESVSKADRLLPETCGAFFFPLRGVCVVFRKRKTEQTFFSDFNTPCDSSFIRTNRTWLIAKTARFARLFAMG